MENKKNLSDIQLTGSPSERIMQFFNLCKGKSIDLNRLMDFLPTANNFATDILGWPKEEYDALRQQHLDEVEMCESLYADVVNKIVMGENDDDIRKFLWKQLSVTLDKEDFYKALKNKENAVYSISEILAGLALLIAALHMLFGREEQPFQSTLWRRLCLASEPESPSSLTLSLGPRDAFAE